MSPPFKSGIIVFTLVTLGWTLFWTSFCFGQTPPQAPAQVPENGSQNSPEPRGAAATGEQLPGQKNTGSISGTVVDQSGAVVAGARVSLTRDQSSSDQPSGNQSSGNQSSSQEALSGTDGQFSFTSVAPGRFQLTITSAGFATQAISGILRAGENYVVPLAALAVAAAVTSVDVGLSRDEVAEVAEEQLKVEEKQRMLGVIPNFYVSYVPDAAPLNPKQKFKLAWKSVVDPVTIVLVGGTAGVEQAQNHFQEYGQGAQGYGKRFGANYADTVVGTFIGGAILPSLLKQDPRYFYKGTGSKASRALYAIANSVICKGDNKRWQANYSSILGGLAAGGISNLYYPEQDRNGAGLTFENAAIGLGETAITNLFQEFVIRKFTPRLPNNAPSKP
jgi:hypothetical protein